MLGRGVAEKLRSALPEALFSAEVVAAAREADLVVLNLECCISEHGTPFPGRVFHFRAPPAAVDALLELGVDCVTLANNHALDFGRGALLDTFEHLSAAGIEWVGAGPVEAPSHAPAVLEADGFRLAVIGVTDHPVEYAPWVAHADLAADPAPDWLLERVRSVEADAMLVTPHWGPNMAAAPVPHVRAAARALVEAGATLVAGHSAHVFQGVEGRVLYDLGDFVDDYRTDPELRNDLGLLWLVDLDERGPSRLEAVPLKLGYCYTRLAEGEDAAWIRRRFTSACAALGTEVTEEGRRLVVTFAR